VEGDEIVGVVPSRAELGQIVRDLGKALLVSLVEEQLEIREKIMLAVPLENPASVLSLPVERIRTAERRPGPRLVDAGREVLDAGLSEELGKAPAEAVDVVVHRRLERKAVGAAEVDGFRHGPDELLGAERIRELEEEAGKLDAAGAEQGQELAGLRFGAAPEIVLERPGNLDVPAELRLLGIAVRGLAELDDGIEIIEVVLGHPGLEIGVADVGMGMRKEIDRPLALRLDRDALRRDQGADFDLDRGLDCRGGVGEKDRHGRTARRDRGQRHVDRLRESSDQDPAGGGRPAVVDLEVDPPPERLPVHDE